MANSIFFEESRGGNLLKGLSGLAALAALLFVGFCVYWMSCVVDLDQNKMLVLTHLTGKDLPNGEELAPDATYKGPQREVVASAGRYFLNPYEYEWKVLPKTAISEGKIGIQTRVAGLDLPPDEILAFKPDHKGIVPGYLTPGLHAVNPYEMQIEEHALTVIPAGYQGVVTNVAAPMPSGEPDFDFTKDDKYSKRLLVKSGFRGVLRETLGEGAYPINPYEQRIDLVDCRSQRFNLGEEGEIGFPSKDGFWVSLDGVVEFRVNPKHASRVYIVYNDAPNGPRMDEEIVRKVILPTARSFCRLQGSNNLGKDFIQGTSRAEFQKEFQAALRTECEPLGIDIIQALITRISPPEQIAKPVRIRELARQQEKQYQQQILQQQAEKQLAIEKEMVIQKQAIIEAEQEVLKVTTEAEREQEVDVTKSEEKAAVAKVNLEAAKDEAAAVEIRGKAASEVVKLQNIADAAGWKAAVDAFNGDGSQFAQYVLFQKLAGSYKSLMINTADSPIMKIFDSFNKPGTGSKPVRATSASADK